MVTIPQLTDRLKTFLGTQIEAVAKTNPMISFGKPLITRALDKNLSKINKTLELIADENGEIDVEAILSEMIESVMTTEPFTFKTPFMGDINIGGGTIKLNIPLTNKSLVFNGQDLEGFKELLTAK